MLFAFSVGCVLTVCYDVGPYSTSTRFAVSTLRRALHRETMSTGLSYRLLSHLPDVNSVSTSVVTNKERETTLLGALSKLQSPAPSDAATLLAVVEDVDACYSQNSIAQINGFTDSEDELVQVVLAKAATNAVALVLDTMLDEALNLEREVEWWRSVESTQWNTTYYLVQSEWLLASSDGHMP